MDIVLVSGRAVDGRPHPSTGWAAAIASALATSHRVRWLCVLDEQQAGPTPPAGVELVVVRTTVPPFRSPLERVFELVSETRLMTMCRGDAPDLVHCLAFGAAASIHLPWLAGRLGIPVIVTVTAAEVLCHRGTLVDEVGASCATFDDADRCTRCCLTSTPSGLGPWAAWLGRAFRWLGDASPWPNRTALRNRLDTAIGGLADERYVLVGADQCRAKLESVGVPANVVRVLPAGDLDRLVELYERVARGSG